MTRTATINGTHVPVPEGAVAYKYADPTEPARWIYDEAEVAEIEREDPRLIVRPDSIPTASLTYRVYTAHLVDMGYSAEDVATFVERLRPALQTEVDEGRWPGLEIEVEVIERTSGAGAGPSVNEWGETAGRPSADRIESEAREISNAVLEGVA